MSRVRYAVRYEGGNLGEYRYKYRKAAHAEAREADGTPVRIVHRDAAETAARRAVIEAAKDLVAGVPLSWDRLCDSAVALEALERKEAAKCGS